MQVTFQFLSGSKAGQSGQFSGERITIGRNPGNTVQFDAYIDMDVSGDHAQLTIGDDGRLRLTDLGSTNGTFLNNQKVSGPPVVLEPGSKVKFGENGPECQVTYTPEKKPGATRMMLAQVQQDLEKEKQKAQESKKKSKVVFIVVAVVLLVGSIVAALMISSSSKRRAAEAAIAQIEERKDDAQGKGAKRLAMSAWERAEGLEEQAAQQLEAGEYEEAKKLAEEARQAYKDATELAEVLSSAHREREDAEGLFAPRYAKAKWQEGETLLADAAEALKKGRYDQVRKLAESAERVFKEAKAEAYQVGITTYVKNATEKAQREQEEKRQRELAELKRQQEEQLERERQDQERRQAAIAAANEAERARLQAELDAINRQKEAIKQAVDMGKQRICLIETQLYIFSQDAPDVAVAKLGAPHYGTGFLFEGGHLVTAKANIYPHLFDAELAGYVKKLAEEKRGVKPQFSLWFYRPSEQKFVKAFSSEGGSVQPGIVQPNVMLGEATKAEIEFGGSKIEVEVTLHDPRQSQLGTLQIAGSLPDVNLSPATGAVELQDEVVGVGSIMDGGASFMPFKGEVSRVSEGLIEFATPAPPETFVGAPVMNTDKQVIGVVVSAGKSRVVVQGVAELQSMLSGG